MHVMLDLETFGSKAGCVVRSIGACLFNPHSVGFTETFYANIDHQSCIDAGLQVEQATADWWSRQDQAAQECLTTDLRPLSVIAVTFKAWFRHHGATHVWCHGASFDVPIWEAAARAVNENVPWHYTKVLDTRTLYHIGAFNVKSVPSVGVAHNALDDCKFQVACVQTAIGRIGPR